MIIFEFLAVFVLILILSLGVSLFALPVAHLFKHIVPSTRPFCTRCLTGWKTKRGLVIRLVWVPFATNPFPGSHVENLQDGLIKQE